MKNDEGRNVFQRKFHKPDIRYEIRCEEISRDEGSRTARLVLPFDSIESEKDEKVILLLGATGTGKSTLVNAVVNHFYGVEYEDPFRLVLIPETEGVRASQSQTTWVTAYELPWQEGCRAPYGLTIVDTPGFGDTKGLTGDKGITTQLQKFFGGGGLKRVDGIGFVVQASSARLTPTEKYIFDSVLSAFGKDVAGNIYVMVTFADNRSQPVLEAIKDGKIPHVDSFPFNNSALYARNDESSDSRIDSMFWRLGAAAFSRFFERFRESTAVSLSLSAEVLKERAALEAIIRGIQDQIQGVLNILAEISEEKAVLERRRAEVEAKKDFTYEVQAPKVRKMDLKGDLATNCSKCNITCHFPCKQRRGDVELQCEVLDPFTGRCMVCPCDSKRHVSRPYRLETYVEKESRNLKDLRASHRDAGTAEDLLGALRKRHSESRSRVLHLLARAHEKLERLEEIALKPNPITITDYVKLLISSEKHEGKPGWMERAKILQEIGERIANEKTADERGSVPFEEPNKNRTELKPRGAHAPGENLVTPNHKNGENAKTEEQMRNLQHQNDEGRNVFQRKFHKPDIRWQLLANEFQRTGTVADSKCSEDPSATQEIINRASEARKEPDEVHATSIVRKANSCINGMLLGWILHPKPQNLGNCWNSLRSRRMLASAGA
ncbi:unnamed protein product, partial [Darwinula stevensoni]